MSETWKRNLAVPFFTQRDNTYIWQQRDKETNKKKGFKYPLAYRSCNITSLCMLLHYWGITGDTPNQMIKEVFEHFGWNHEEYVCNYDKGEFKGGASLESWENLRKIAEHYTQNYKDNNSNPIYKIIGGKEENNFTLEFAREQIAKGCPVMVTSGLASFINDNNSYKGDGHIVVVRGFTNDGDVILNDPYGIPVDNAGEIKPLTGEARGQNNGTIIAGYYYNSPAASVGDNIVIKKVEFDKICKNTGTRYISIEGPLWQHPCEPMTEPDSENGYPIKTNNYWHNGIHLQSADGFRSIGSGRLVAARNADVAGDDGQTHGSSSFALVRYQLPVSGTPFFYALYMHLKTVDLKSELHTFMTTGSVSEPLRGIWYEQIFNNLLPRYKIFDLSLPKSIAADAKNYNAIYEAEIKDGIFKVKINEESPQKEEVLMNFGDAANEASVLSRQMKAYLLPVKKFKTICDIESYSDIANLRFMVSTSDTDFKNDEGYYFFYCGNGRGRKLCCCKNEKINGVKTFASYNIYNEKNYSYYVKKLYSLYKGEVITFPEIRSEPNFQEIKGDEKDSITTSSILTRELVYYKNDALECGFRLGNNNIGITDSYAHIKSDAEQLCRDIVQLLELYSNTGDEKVSKNFNQMLKNYMRERKEQIEKLLYSITMRIDEEKEMLDGIRPSIKTDKEWMLSFYQDAEKKLNAKEILGVEGTYVPKGKGINDAAMYDDIRKTFEEILDKYKEYDVQSVVAICEYLMIKFVSIPKKDIAGGKGERFVYRRDKKSKTIISLFKIWEESLGGQDLTQKEGNSHSIYSLYKNFFKERYIDNFIEISKGAKIGYGTKIPESETADSIHFEIFSGANLLEGTKEPVVEFDDIDNFYAPEKITKAIFDSGCFSEEYMKTNFKYYEQNLLTSKEIRGAYKKSDVLRKMVSHHISEWEKMNYREEAVKSMFNIRKKKDHSKEKVNLKNYFDKIYNEYCWFNKDLLNKDDKKITDKLYFYHPEYFIETLSSKGSSASLKETGEVTIEQVIFVDKDENPVKNNINLFTNLKKSTYVKNDNIDDNIRCQIKFSQQGNFKYSLRLNKIKSVADYTEAEKKYFSAILHTDKKIEFTGSQDSIINITDFFSFGQIGGTRFKVEAEYNGKTVETDYTVTVWRLLYLNVFNGADFNINMDSIKKIFEKYYLKLEVLNLQTVETEAILDHSSNNGNSSRIESFIKTQIDKSFNNSFTLNLFLVKNIMSTTVVECTLIPKQNNIIELNLFNERLFLSSYPEEDWFCHGYYIDSEGQTFYLTKENFSVLKEKNLLYGLRLDLSGNPKKISKVIFKLKVIADIKSGLSFEGKNYVALATEILGEKFAMLDIEHTCIHEIGHKLGLVSDGTKGLDKGFHHYSGRGHLGNHCHYGTSLVNNFENKNSLDGSKCIMFGTTNKSTDFCESCGNTLIKSDFSNGIIGK